MSHEHAHAHGHGHEHGHEHAHERPAPAEGSSVLMRGAASRVLAALAAVALLWAAVAWALTDLSA